MKNKCAGRGFTLIELLTVIAIIAILAAMVFVAFPRVIEMTRLANLQNTCNQIRTIAVADLASKQSLPPGYGYKLTGGGYNVKPYLTYFDTAFGNFKIYDPFGMDTYDTDQDSALSLLEFCPIGIRDAVGNPIFPPDLYVGPGTVPAEEKLQLNAKQRPMVYIPVNLKDAEKVRKYYLLLAAKAGREEDGQFARCWLPNESLAPEKNPLSSPITVPPRRYDAFVLISVGPNRHTGGILARNQNFETDLNNAGIAKVEDMYYYYALRAYYLATRDLNRDNNFDFDYQNRMKGNAADKQYPLPDGSMRPGPIIYHFAG